MILIALKTKAQSDFIPYNAYYSIDNSNFYFKFQYNFNKPKENKFIIDITNHNDLKQYRYLNFIIKYEDLNNYIIEKHYSIFSTELYEGVTKNIAFSYGGYEIDTILKVYASNDPLTKNSGIEIKIGPAKSAKADYILSGNNYYSGTNIKLTVKGGILGLRGNWKWYIDTTKESINLGESINYYITKTTTFYVRAEDKKGKTDFISKTITVNDLSYPAYSISYNSNTTDHYNSVMTLYKTGGILGKNAKWVWYKDSCGKYKLGEGEEIKFKPKRHNKIFVRAEGSANNTVCTNLIFDYRLKILPYNFININYKIQNQNSQNYGLIIGNEKYYLSINLDINNFTIKNNQNLVSENYVLKNFNSQNSTNANFNDQKYISNNSFVLGIMKGNNKYKFYGGLGYGMRNTYNQVDVHNANDGTLAYKNWVKNNDLETNGGVIQLGVFYRYKNFNSLIGIESIKSLKNNNYFTDMHIGLGLTLNKKH
jgi:hypothetical protein